MDHLSNTMRLFLAATDHEISGGCEYQWSSYGPKARFINCDNDLASCYAIHDAEKRTVYEIGVQSEGDGPMANYRWINPAYLEAYKAEAKRRKIAWNNPSDPTAPDFEDHRWKDTNVVDDICEKAHAIRNGLPYNPDLT